MSDLSSTILGKSSTTIAFTVVEDEKVFFYSCLWVAGSAIFQAENYDINIDIQIIGHTGSETSKRMLSSLNRTIGESGDVSAVSLRLCYETAGLFP